MNDMIMLSLVFWGEVVEAVVVQLLPVDHVVPISVYLTEKSVEVPLDRASPEGASVVETLSQPCFKLASLKTVVAVYVMAKEDLLDERMTVCAHFEWIVL
jgi:hypothetical protein